MASRGKKKGKVRFVDNVPGTEKTPISRNIFSVLPDLVPEGGGLELATTVPRLEGEEEGSQGGECSANGAADRAEGAEFSRHSAESD